MPEVLAGSALQVGSTLPVGSTFRSDDNGPSGGNGRPEGRPYWKSDDDGSGDSGLNGGGLGGSGLVGSGTKGKASVDSGVDVACELTDLGRVRYAEAMEMQHRLVEQRKRGEIPDQLLIVEHPHVVTLGRNAHMANVLASPAVLERAGIEMHASDRGGDVTYHGPGQIVGYPIVDLREWKRDVGAYLRALEQVLIETLREFGITGSRVAGATGVWVDGAKVAAMGVHISRWVTSHGFALNVDPDLDYFRYIVPCGLEQPVTSMRALGSSAGREEVVAAIAAAFAKVFGRVIMEKR
jgi:lipoyl(octanoyl) transferase